MFVVNVFKNLIYFWNNFEKKLIKKILFIKNLRWEKIYGLESFVYKNRITCVRYFCL